MMLVVITLTLLVGKEIIFLAVLQGEKSAIVTVRERFDRLVKYLNNALSVVLWGPVGWHGLSRSS